ncbi:uncharacterized protein BT62DRAFT_933403 [Guyanagaster necrorhizus]|uniref:Calcium channel YVC1 n=1 Tax=Guyanagaster necrorhizus TaxID=856835 RepID=A0A9P7VR90_9AGAR|nr:uncharacterized protein BT62DRAFT_933403 [Guyanagaster necrorhizus MCA 3950]KAG7444990.1 hypothetical protein BT62DRAFT_933403 [Guyanagaster necrorhizus MCA 3950]
MVPGEISESQPLLSPSDVDATEVYPIIHMIRADITHFIDTPLTYEALTAPDLTYTLIRPLFEKYAALQRAGNMSIVFCFLLNRVHFIRDQGMATASVSRTRAELCEILAIRVLRDYADNMLDLVHALSTSWSVYNGADRALMQAAREEREDLEERVGNAIEMAILGRAKRFIKSSSCQKVIDGIWTGKCVYQATSSHSILSDTYKRTPIHFYDPHKAPLLDHYRLKVPAIRSVLEYMNFLILFVLFVTAIEINQLDSINAAEMAFLIYGLGFSLEKVAAMQEHGMQVYFKGTWNGFDLALVTTYLIYAILRVYGVYHHDPWARKAGIDCLALIACLLFPRLAFVTLKNNLMVLSLRAMMMQFVVLMLIAAFCFCGFLYALWTLSRNEAGYSVGTIAWWMLDLWFGLDASGFDRATQFHRVIGPVLMVTYACLSNTLLLTVLVSILSNTFATINEDAAAEAMFRRAVSTIEGVKADSLFSYQPPINLIAVCIMLPARYILTPRWFHKVNVFMIRATSFPILLMIAFYERQAKFYGTIGFSETFTVAAEKVYDTLPKGLKWLALFEGLTRSDADIDAIFEIDDELNSSALDTYPHVSNGSLLSSQNRNSTPSSPPSRTAPQANTPGQQQPPHVNHPHFDDSLGNAPSHSPSQPFPIARTRVNSILNRGFESAQSFTSPLAQIFQPLVLHDDPIADEGPSPPHLVSFGPASRRRLSSMHQHRRGTTDGGYGHHSPTHQRSQEGSNFKRTDGSGPLSESPPAVTSMSSPEDNSSMNLLTAAAVKEEEADSGGYWEKFAELETRQERMEKLLEKIAHSLKVKGG